MKRCRSRNGQTMLELIAAATLVTTALVPALKLFRRSVLNSVELEHAEERLTLCTSKLEEELAFTAARWDLTSYTGKFDHADDRLFRFQVSKSDALSQGGIPNALATVEVIVWEDDNGDGGLNQDEERVRLGSKIARMLSYTEGSGRE